MNSKVIKRDGSIQDYDKIKIERVVKAAGLNDEQATDLASKVSDWVKTQDNEITSLQIRDRVIVEIQKVDRTAANLFIWYEKTKDKEETS